MKTIIITGTPGTGKTTLAKSIAKSKGYTHLDLTKLIKKNKWFDSFDKKNDCLVVDDKMLAKNLLKEIEKLKNAGKKGVVIDSHMSSCLPKSAVDLCIIVKCELKELRKRLAKRGYTEKKIMDNLEAEIFKVCEEEARQKGYKLLFIDATYKIPEKIIASFFLL